MAICGTAHSSQGSAFSNAEADQKYSLGFVEYSRVEDPNSYHSGGLHPIQIGDQLGEGNRFRVVHKLGYGGFSTVWLCRDQLLEKWRAVKIIQARGSKPEECADYKIFNFFHRFPQQELEDHHIASPLEFFWLEGPNGRHFCVVLPFLGPPLVNIFSHYAHCPDLLKDICFQLVQSMDFLHRNGLCHGDFRPHNILLRLKENVDEWSEDDILNLLGKPRRVKVWPLNKDDRIGPESEVPEFLIDAASVKYSTGVCTTRVAITDFGVSYNLSEPPSGTGIPMSYKSPEELFRSLPLGVAADVWALASTICEVGLGHLPFDASEEFELVKDMEAVMGPLPQKYRPVWKDWELPFANGEDDLSLPVTIGSDQEAVLRQSRARYGKPTHVLQFIARGGWQDGLPMCITQQQADEILEQYRRGSGMLPGFKEDEDSFGMGIRKHMSEAEGDMLVDLVMSVFKWDAKERASTTDLLNHPWFEGRNSDDLKSTVIGLGDLDRTGLKQSPSTGRTTTLGADNSSVLTTEASENQSTSTSVSSGIDLALDELPQTEDSAVVDSACFAGQDTTIKDNGNTGLGAAALTTLSESSPKITEVDSIEITEEDDSSFEIIEADDSSAKSTEERDRPVEVTGGEHSTVVINVEHENPLETIQEDPAEPEIVPPEPEIIAIPKTRSLKTLRRRFRLKAETPKRTISPPEQTRPEKMQKMGNCPSPVRDATPDSAGAKRGHTKGVSTVVNHVGFWWKGLASLVRRHKWGRRRAVAVGC
ncbi:kinase-like domain-containing protein [Cercophora scortea]|uniref:EKC/KEOPS complex subunit BUD32 n=1 Tax=Cercophora scortea TaxID=314031 RepID=A0AAE0IZN9_9PEZI|nr:kinase-like domain-containing protein [Cercophora scortea]